MEFFQHRQSTMRRNKKALSKYLTINSDESVGILYSSWLLE